MGRIEEAANGNAVDALYDTCRISMGAAGEGGSRKRLFTLRRRPVRRWTTNDSCYCCCWGNCVYVWGLRIRNGFFGPRVGVKTVTHAMKRRLDRYICIYTCVCMCLRVCVYVHIALGVRQDKSLRGVERKKNA